MQLHILLLWLFFAEPNLAQDWIQVEKYEAQIGGVYGSDGTEQLDDTLSRPLRSISSDAEDSQLADSDEAVVLDENGKPRDKRTLGFIVRTLATALGYTVSPIQVASLPNPPPPPSAPPAPPAPKAPVAPPKTPAPPSPPAPKAPPPKAPPAATPPAKAPASPPQPRRRETLRVTGLVNFGPNANANLEAQLGQYEQLFHGNAAAAQPAPARPPAPAPTPAPAPLPKPNLPKIPSPIVPNLAPLLPPSRPPVSIPGNTPLKPKAGTPAKQEVETEYRKNENLERFNVQNEEIQGDRNPYLVLPGNTYVQEPDWRHGYFARLKELEDRQKEYADKLEKHEALLAKHRQDHENTDERFVNREKEIAERDEAHTARIRNRERPEIIQEDGEKFKTEVEGSREDYDDAEKPLDGYERPRSSESEEKPPQKYENEEERSPEEYLAYDEEPKKYQDYDDYPQKYSSYHSEDDGKLPILKDKAISKSEDIRNSYGESLEDQGKINENIADYFVNFKDPNTGLYVPEKTQEPDNYNNEKQPWWKGKQGDFENRLERLEKEYALPAPESKYEEYELEEGPDESNKPLDKLERVNEEDEKTPESNNAQIPDYSEAFGGYDRYEKKIEPELSQEIVSSPRDTEESPRSESQEEANDNLQEAEKSEDGKEIPLYQFDFKSFLPYHSPIKYFYNSDDAETTTVSGIQSYNEDSSAPERAEHTREDLPVEREELKEEHLALGLPEKLTMKNLHDGESKELRAWPAPFDYVFDSTEQTNVAELPRIKAPPGTEIPSEAHDLYPREELQDTPVEYLSPEYDTMFGGQQGRQQQERDPESFHGEQRATQNLQENPNDFGFHGYSRLTSALADISGQSQATLAPESRYNFPENNRQKNHQYISQDYPFVNHQQNYPTDAKPDYVGSNPRQATSSSSSDGSNHHESRHRYQPGESQYNRQIVYENAPISQDGPSRHFGPGNSDLRNRGHNLPIPNYTPVEPHPPRNADLRNHGHNLPVPNYPPAEPHPSGRRFDENRNHQPQYQEQGQVTHPEDRSSLRFDDPKSAHDFFGFSQNDYDFENKDRSEKSQSAVDNDESSDLLVVSEPTPYEYDLKLTEYTDEPESDTEKVKVKEYRNKVATVTISEKKQLSPEGPVRLFGYSHQY